MIVVVFVLEHTTKAPLYPLQDFKGDMHCLVVKVNCWSHALI